MSARNPLLGLCFLPLPPFPDVASDQADHDLLPLRRTSQHRRWCVARHRVTNKADIYAGTESLGVALLLLMFLYSNADSPNYTALVSIVAAYLVYSVYSFSSSVRRFVQTRTLGELLKRVETADKLAVSYAGSRNALDANQVMALDEHESSVLKYRQCVSRRLVVRARDPHTCGHRFKLKSLHGLRTAHYGGQFNRVWLDALPRLRVMWGLSDLTDALEVRTRTASPQDAS